MLRESLSVDRPKGLGNVNGPSSPSMSPRSFRRIVTWKKAYVTIIADSYRTRTWCGYGKATMGCLREKDELIGNR